jgi:DNA-binding CsgD family transcriptional regulator
MHTALLQSRGLVEDAPDDLVAAAEEMHRSPRLVARASAAEDAGRVMLDRGSTDAARTLLDAALDSYEQANATRDASRVRARLRAAGVRRRPARSGPTTDRPASGWASLTVAERRVVDLAVQGATNRTIGEQLFISPYTVATHMKHIFTKLAINSRVELTRLAAANA